MLTVMPIKLQVLTFGDMECSTHFLPSQHKKLAVTLKSKTEIILTVAQLTVLVVEKLASRGNGM